MIRNREKQLQTLTELITAHAPHMVQVICLTINGRKVICLGPVIHVPSLDIQAGTIEDIEFGELVPAHLAAQLLSGEFSEGLPMQ